MKSKHTFINGIIPYQELKYFIEPITVTIPIPLMDLKSIGGIKKDELYSVYNHALGDILDKMPVLKERLKENLNHLAILSYTPHINGYDFRIHPINLINSILKVLGFNEIIPFFNLDDENERKVFKEYAKKNIEKLKKDGIFLEELEELSSRISYINLLYDIDVENNLKKNNFILAKDALLYLSYSSLLEYQKTGKKEYLRIPYEYYNYIGHMKTSSFPHKIRVGESRLLWFNDFMNHYEICPGKEYIPIFNQYNLENNTLLCGWEILGSGEKETTFKRVAEAIKRTRNTQNNERNLKMFQMKTNFFESSPYLAMIKGLYGLNGYLGFVYKNDYIVYDKFYNNEDVADDKKTILSHPEAIYNIPSDRITVTSYNKQKLKEIKEKDKRIIKVNHTFSGSFINKIEEIIKGPNVSTEPFSSVVEKESNLLILRRKNNK